MVAVGRLERPTRRVWADCSNQLSYTANLFFSSLSPCLHQPFSSQVQEEQIISKSLTSIFFITFAYIASLFQKLLPDLILSFKRTNSSILFGSISSLHFVAELGQYLHTSSFLANYFNYGWFLFYSLEILVRFSMKSSL